MTTKALFERLVEQISLDESSDEKEAIIYWLLEHELQFSRSQILSAQSTTAEPSLFSDFLTRINSHEPIQYILAEACFYGRKFFVNPKVLIPRPETELIVTIVRDHFAKKRNTLITDIGTGSGCIALSLALELESPQILATDISTEALEVAKKNRQDLRAPVKFLQHDILKERLPTGMIDAVVSNPPYVMEREKVNLKKNVLGYEPSQALFVPDADPLAFHRAIAEKAFGSLKPGGLLITEINEQLAQETAALFESVGFHTIHIHHDMNHRPRTVSAIR